MVMMPFPWLSHVECDIAVTVTGLVPVAHTANLTTIRIIIFVKVLNVLKKTEHCLVS